MDKRIGVGIIVGLMIASSMFVYNSSKFSKLQKVILLVFVVFPPLQWVSIIILLVINYYKEQNSAQNISLRKAKSDNAKFGDKLNVLNELRSKGLLTEDEYREKAENLRKAQLVIELKASDDYRKLKSLFDANILTKEEFEQKLEILAKRPPVVSSTSYISEPLININHYSAKVVLGIIILIIGVFFLVRNSKLTGQSTATYNGDYNNNTDDILADNSGMDTLITADEPEDTLEKIPKVITLKSTLVLFDNINGIYPGQSSLNDIKSIMGEPDYIDVTKLETHSGEITGGNKLVKYVKSGLRFLFTADDTNMSAVDGILISKNFDGVSKEGIYIGMKKDACLRILNNYYSQYGEAGDSMSFSEKKGDIWKLQVWFKNGKLESLEIF